MYKRHYPLFFEIRLQLVPLFCFDDIQVKYLPVVIPQGRRLNRTVLQQLIISRRHAITLFIPGVQMAQFDSEHRSLNSLHTGIVAHHIVVVFSVGTVIPQHPEFPGQALLTGDDRTPFPVGAKILPRVK